ncbi:MAG: prepilin-type N-terminal cleavage/methylation domain-containing protein [Bacilli bacterium]|nr:prepilin-type N-terminal cleavage/methylation domain-containing protein [Bacilli bacterium]
MKKINKKGFTLIELLAVIIILGILMIIAIPSVTTYIQNSRRSAYLDTAEAYIASVRTKVNEANKLKLFNPKTLYLIPVSHVEADSCVSVESGGQSPYHDEWVYAYVGVRYHQDTNGEAGYDYYFVSEDKANQGIYYSSQKEFSTTGNELVYSARTTSKLSDAVHTLLVNNYKKSKVYTVGTGTGENVITLDTLKSGLKAASDTDASISEISKVEFVAAGTNCVNVSD